MTDRPPGRKERERLLRLLIRAFPAEFRAQFGDELLEALVSDRRAARAKGPLATGRFWLRALPNTLLPGMMERIESARRPRRQVEPNMSPIIRELSHATRRLVRRPGFTAAAAGTVALGIGATTALFSVLDGVLLRPLPYADAQSLVYLGHESHSDELGLPDGGYLHYAERSRTLADIGLYLETSSPVVGGDRPLELGIIQASQNLLPMLGVAPARGRGFAEEDHLPGATPVAVVTHEYWVNHLGADPNALGAPVAPGSTRTVVGILPEGFAFERPQAIVVFGNRFRQPHIFVPLAALNPANARFGNFMYQGLARLAPGATAEEARDELQVLMREAAEHYPNGLSVGALDDGGYGPVVVSLKDYLVRDVSGVLKLLMGAALVVLLIAIANVTNLFLVRADARAGEFAIRRALGASDRAVRWAFFSDVALTSVVGGLVGVLLAFAGTRGLLTLAPASLPYLDEVGVNPRALLFAALVTLVASFGVAAFPLLRERARSLRSGVGVTGRGTTADSERNRARLALLVGQVALAATLLIGSGLLVQTSRNLQRVDPGFDGSQTLSMRLSLSTALLRATGRTEPSGDLARTRLMLELTERVRQLPGVLQASFSADLPLDGDEWHDHVASDDDIPASNAETHKVARVFVGPGYLEAIGARVPEGREMTLSDFEGQPRTAVVNRAFTELFWPGQPALGRRIGQFVPGMHPEQDVWYTVVGVADDVREASLSVAPEPTVYLPTAFLPNSGYAMWISNMVLVVRGRGDASALSERVRAAVQAYRPDIPINNVATLDQVAARSYEDVSFATALIGIAAVAAMLLGIIGIYGAVSYVVGQRTREFGIRIALGATPSRVLRLVLSSGGKLAILGTGLGILMALIVGRVLDSMLFGIEPTDPWVYVTVAVGLSAVVLASALLPAMKAAAVDPTSAMRSE